MFGIRRLLADKAGNTMVILGAALVPLLIMFGSGVDMSLAYMTRSELQNACDAAALAGRQTMDGKTWTPAAKREAEKFFDFNFPAGLHGVTDVEFEVEQDEDDSAQVIGSATAVLPTSVMWIFGFETIDLAVRCDAKRDLGRNDVMLVLDVTGTMLQQPSGGGPPKFALLRDAVSTMFTVLHDEDDPTKTRYGFMPYATTVNVGRSLEDRDILDNQQYVDLDCGGGGCPGGVPGIKIVPVSESSWSVGGTGTIADFRLSGDACIEERPSVGNSYSPFEIEATVSRADIDARAADSTDTLLQFGRYDENVQEGGWLPWCPSEAIPLQSYDSEADFDAAVRSATTRLNGNTYHDVGVLWGARFLSRTGIFKDENPTEISGVTVGQHLVFLTDGVMNASGFFYSHHGVDRHQHRTKGSGSVEERHLARFESACRRAKEMGMTVWVIALDVVAVSDIERCATSPGHFFTSDGSDLEDVFKAIAVRISSLRLTR